MRKKIYFNFDEEIGVTIATLKTRIGTFLGSSKQNDDDPLHPSFMVGSIIAEARAYIKFINKKIALKRYELKGLKRLKGSMPSSVEGYHYVENLYDTILDEILMLKREKKAWKDQINSAIKSRELYIRIRTTDKKAKEEMLNNIKQGFKTLENISKEDKKD